MLTFYCVYYLTGHMQQGGSPSVFDRNMGTKMAAKVVNWMTDLLIKNRKEDGSVYCTDPSTAALLGLRRRAYE